MKKTESAQFDKFFQDFREEIHTHYVKVFKILNNIKQHSQNHKSLPKTVVNKAQV